MAPWADVLYAADTDWWDHKNGVPDFAGERWTVSIEAAKKYGLNYLEAKSSWLWSTTQGAVATGGNSGFQLINKAALDGAERIILLGYDMGHATGADKHWWDKQHPRESRYSNYKLWLEYIRKAAKYIDIPVLNASRESAIESFPRVDLKEVLA